jgi:hypothetical protein
MPWFGDRLPPTCWPPKPVNVDSHRDYAVWCRTSHQIPIVHVYNPPECQLYRHQIPIPKLIDCKMFFPGQLTYANFPIPISGFRGSDERGKWGREVRCGRHHFLHHLNAQPNCHTKIGMMPHDPEPGHLFFPVSPVSIVRLEFQTIKIIDKGHRSISAPNPSHLVVYPNNGTHMSIVLSWK